MTPARSPSAIDHLVLPVASLQVATTRLSALGFRVAPPGNHPFGTRNACVYLADGTFLEPLATGDADVVAAATRAGNTFTARDAAFRGEVAPEGMSALVLSTNDARADHARLEKAGLSAGPVLDFSRSFVDASGRSDTASFRLAFAAPGKEAGAFFFACQLVHVPAVDRTALTRHGNGVVALREITMHSDDPAAVVEAVSALAGGIAPQPTADGLSMSFADGKRLTIRQIKSGSHARHRFTSVVFAVSSLRHAEGVLTANEVAFDVVEERISVPASPGQGVPFVFKEIQ